MTNLDTIGLRHGTDKASNDHNYLPFYETFFAPLREKKVSVLEIGVLGGASLRTWKEYFSAAKIVGADIDPTAKSLESDRVFIEILDQSNIEELTHAAIKHGPFEVADGRDCVSGFEQPLCGVQIEVTQHGGPRVSGRSLLAEL